MTPPDAPRPPAAEGAPPRGSLEEWIDAASVAAQRGETITVPKTYALPLLERARPAPPVTAAERAALDRLAARSYGESIIDGPAGMADLRAVVALARRAVGGADAE